MELNLHGETFEKIDGLIKWQAHQFSSGTYLTESDFDDLVQIGWMTVMEVSEKFIPGGAKFSTFAVSCVRLRLLSHHKRTKDHYEWDQAYMALPQRATSEPFSELASILEILDSMSVSQKNILLLKSFGYTNGEIAEYAGVNIGKIESLGWYAKEGLRKRLEDPDKAIALPSNDKRLLENKHLTV